ncbi:hypothetical protein GCM10028820_24950 [Tessaracoccus terricola]
MASRTRPRFSTGATALAVALVLGVVGAGWLRLPQAAAEPTEQTTQLCRGASQCRILWQGGTPDFLSSQTKQVLLQGNPGATVQLAMYEILFEDGQVVGISQYRTTDDITIGDDGYSPSVTEFNAIDPDTQPKSGYGLVSVADLPPDTTDFSQLFGEVYPMAHAIPFVLGEGLDEGAIPGAEATVTFLGGAPTVEYQLEFRPSPDAAWEVVSHEPVRASAPPDWERTITYTVPQPTTEGSFQLVPSDADMPRSPWDVTITEEGSSTPNQPRPNAPEVGVPVWPEPEPTNTDGPSEDPDPSGEPEPTASPDPTEEPEPSEPGDPAPTPSSPDPTTSQPDPTPRPTPPATSRPRPTTPTTTPTTPPSAQPTQPSEPAPEPPSAAPTPTPEPTQFGSAPPEPEERVRTQEQAERVTDAASGAATAPRWSGALVGGLATAAMAGAAVWLWRSRREAASILSRWEDE